MVRRRSAISEECTLKSWASPARSSGSNDFVETFDETLQFLSLEEYRRQQNLGQLQKRAKELSVSDKNLQIALSYSKEPPFVAGACQVKATSLSPATATRFLGSEGRRPAFALASVDLPLSPTALIAVT